MNSVVSERLSFYGNLTDKNSYHTYGKIYDELMHDKLDDKLRIMEIGVDAFGSIMAWSDCFPEAEIVGIDINLGYEQTIQGRYCRKQDNITLIEADATDIDLKVKGKFDFIIDDGSHKIEEVEKSFVKFFPQLKKGGYYIIEDVQDHRQWMPIIQGAIQTKLKGRGEFDCRMLDVNRVFDDIIYLIKKL